MKNVIIVHYSEIALKGKNKKFFQGVLKNNILSAVKGIEIDAFKIIEGRFLIYCRMENKDLLCEKISKVFGIYSFCFAKEISNDLEEIKYFCLQEFKKKEFSSFKILTKRAYKKYPYNSMQTSELVGGHIFDNIKTKVDLKNPDVICTLEIVKEHAYVYFEKTKGLGGLPVGSAGKVISLLSSGIDSPVASYKMLKRGCHVVFVHFHNYPYSKKESINNVKKLVKVLEQYQFFSRLYLVSLTDIQKQIVALCSPKLRIVLYRRMMLRIAEKIAKKEGALGLVTGDSLGQVASQTLENIFSISQAVSYPIYRPLISDDKQEIMDLAKKINTYEISIQPYEDCCQLFAPKNPETRSKLKDVLVEEEKLDCEKLIEKIDFEIFK